MTLTGSSCERLIVNSTGSNVTPSGTDRVRMCVSDYCQNTVVKESAVNNDVKSKAEVRTLGRLRVTGEVRLPVFLP